MTPKSRERFSTSLKLVKANRGNISVCLEKATGYYVNTKVSTKEGVVFLSGQTKSDQLKA